MLFSSQIMSSNESVYSNFDSSRISRKTTTRRQENAIKFIDESQASIDADMRKIEQSKVVDLN